MIFFDYVKLSSVNNYYFIIFLVYHLYFFNIYYRYRCIVHIHYLHDLNYLFESNHFKKLY